MFTIVYPPISDIKDEIARRRIVTVKFVDVPASRELTKAFEFNINETTTVIKKKVTEYLNELNTTPPVLTDLDPVADPVPVVPTQAELDRIEWEKDVARLKKAYSDMINLGVTLTAGQLSALTTLRNKIATNFKNEYLG